MKKFYIIFLLLSAISLNAQVGIGTNNPNDGSILHMEGNGSLLLPRVSLSSITDSSIIPGTSTDTLQKGMVLYNTNSALTDGEGIYYWDGAKWVKLALSTGTAPAASIFNVITTTTAATTLAQDVHHQGAVTLGNNIDEKGALLNLDADDKGLLLNRVDLESLTSPKPLRPLATDAMSEGMLVYHTGANSIREGMYYWDGAKWNVLFSGSTVKPMNALFGDNDTYPEGGNSISVTSAPDLYLLQCDYDSSNDFRIKNDPIGGFNFLSDTRGDHVFDSETGAVTTNNTATDGLEDLINFPSQSLNSAITINLSLKYQQTTSNSDGARIVAFASSDGNTYDIKIKDAFYKLSKTSTAFNYVRDELSLNNIIVTQDIVDHGLRIYIGKSLTGSLEFYEPVLTINYGSITL